MVNQKINVNNIKLKYAEVYLENKLNWKGGKKCSEEKEINKVVNQMQCVDKYLKNYLTQEGIKIIKNKN